MVRIKGKKEFFSLAELMTTHTAEDAVARLGLEISEVILEAAHRAHIPRWRFPYVTGYKERRLNKIIDDDDAETTIKEVAEILFSLGHRVRLSIEPTEGDGR